MYKNHVFFGMVCPFLHLFDIQYQSQEDSSHDIELNKEQKTIQNRSSDMSFFYVVWITYVPRMKYPKT